MAEPDDVDLANLTQPEISALIAECRRAVERLAGDSTPTIVILGDGVVCYWSHNLISKTELVRVLHQVAINLARREDLPSPCKTQTAWDGNAEWE